MKEWKEYADLVSDCYNVDIARCSSFSEKLNENVLQEHRERIQTRRESNTYKYTCLCGSCGTKSTRIMKRSPKWYTHTEQYRCNKCHSKQLNVWREPIFN